MRKFIDIINEIFGTGSLSRTTDENEVIDFKVFCTDPEDVDSVKAIISRFSVEYTVREPSRVFQKYTFLCRGSRKNAESISRNVKMVRLNGGITRID